MLLTIVRRYATILKDTGSNYMQFLSIREFSKAPKAALSKLAKDGKAVLTNNGKPAAIMININTESFEQVFNLVQEIEKRLESFERLMKFPRKKAPVDFDYKKEFMEAVDERYGSIN